MSDTIPLPINIPSTPFESSDGSDGVERNELTTRQNIMFNSYLSRKRYKDFGEWWEKEGREELSSVYNEAIINNEKITDDGNISNWWKKYLNNNLSQIIRQLKFMQIWGF